MEIVFSVDMKTHTIWVSHLKIKRFNRVWSAQVSGIWVFFICTQKTHQFLIPLYTAVATASVMCYLSSSSLSSLSFKHTYDNINLIYWLHVRRISPSAPSISNRDATISTLIIFIRYIHIFIITLYRSYNYRNSQKSCRLRFAAHVSCTVILVVLFSLMYNVKDWIGRTI